MSNEQQLWLDLIKERAANERLRAALKTIADDPDTNVEAAVYARNTLATEQKVSTDG